jgi:3,4-dihydroxy 2-butanone 4-phosphate synthase/GTP cyclohydrolase II
MPFAPIEDVLAELRAGRMIILTDDESRENEGDLVLPAQFVSPEAITFMLSVARGYLCVALTGEDCDRLDLHPQAAINTTQRGTAFTVSIDGHPRHGFTTGVSAKERARTIQMMIDPRTGPGDFVRPGHINPLRARAGGTLVRTGQTEGSIDLCALAGLHPSALIIEIMRDDGEMARLPDLQALAQKHNLKMCSVAQIIQHRLRSESLVQRLEPRAGTPVDTAAGRFNLIAFRSLVDPLPHIALTLGGVGELNVQGQPIEHPGPTLVRMHRRNLLADLFAGRAAHAGGSGGGVGGVGGGAGGEVDVLRRSMAMIQREGRGAIVYLRPEGGSDTLERTLNTIARPGHDRSADDPDLAHPDGHAAGLPATMRDFGVGGQILRQLGLSRLRLITNQSATLPGLEAFGLSIVERVGMV